MAEDYVAYPTEETLDYIKSWQYDAKVLADFLALVHSWWAPDGRFQVKTRTLELATGGWSGNEEIQGALDHNMMFQILHWKMSKRGGLTVYEIPRSVATRLKSLIGAG